MISTMLKQNFSLSRIAMRPQSWQVILLGITILMMPTFCLAQASTVDPTVCGGSTPPSWCSGTDIGAWINAAASYVHTTYAGGIIRIPAGSYTQSTEVNPLYSDIEIVGAGAGSTILNATSGFASRNFHPVGTSATPIKNLRIDNLSITNGTPTATNLTGGRDGIRCEYCSQVEFDHLNISSIQGYYGIATVNSNNVRIHDNSVTNFGYGGVMTLVNSSGTSSNIWIKDNYIDNCVNTTTTLCYGIGTSASEDSTVPGTVNAWVLHNVVGDIHTWECYDTHDGTNLTFEDNTGFNCYFGMQFGSVTGGSITHLTVRRNHLTQGGAGGGAKLNGYGIAIAGTSLSSPVTDVLLEGNYLDGYGSSSTGGGDSVGAITLASTQNAKLINNICNTYYQACIDLFTNNLTTTITGNWSGNALGAFTPSATAEILIDSGGSWGVYIDNNVSSPSSVAMTPASFFYDGSPNTQVSFGPNNQMNGPSTTTITGSSATTSMVAGGYYPMALQHTPTSSDTRLINFQGGTIGYDQAYRPSYIFSPPAATPYYLNGGGFYSLNTSSVISTGNMTVTSAVLSGLSGGLGTTTWYYWLPIGMNITVAGAGTGGGNLNARVVQNDGTQIVLDTAALASVTAKNITWQGGQVFPIQANQQDPLQTWGTTANGLCNTGCIQTSGTDNYSGTGFLYGTRAPFFVVNAVLTPGLDKWTQSNPSYPSKIFAVDQANGIQEFTAVAGKTSGTFASFWTAVLSGLTGNASKIVTATALAGANGNIPTEDGSGNVQDSSVSLNKAVRNCGTLTTTNSTSDSLSCSWVTSSSGCQVVPIGVKAVNLTTGSTYAVTLTAGSVLVSHSNGTTNNPASFAVTCSAN